MITRAIYLGIVLVASAVPVSAQDRPALDTRERIEVPAEARDQVLAEMRLMLSAISEIAAALGEGDASAAAEAARSAGMAVAVDVAPGVRERLPQPFVELGAATHQHFDALAERLEQNVGVQEAFAELGALTRKCVTCHETWRLDEAP